MKVFILESVDLIARAARVGKIKVYAQKKDAQFARSMNKADTRAAHARRGGRTMPASSSDRYDLATMSAIKRNRANGLVRKFDKTLPPYQTNLQHMADVMQVRGEQRMLKDRYKRVGATLKARRAGSPFKAKP